MGTPLIMTLGEACQLVTEYAKIYTEGDVLEGLKSMQECWDDLDKEDRVAYTMFMDAGYKMFAPLEQ